MAHRAREFDLAGERVESENTNRDRGAQCPVKVSDPTIRKMLQLAGLRFIISRARWLISEAIKLGLGLKSGKMTSDEVDAALAEIGALDLVYPELTGSP